MPNSDLRDRILIESARSARLRGEVIEMARQEAALTRAQLARRRWLLSAALIAVPVLIFVALGGVRSQGRPGFLVLETALGSSVLAAGAAIVALGRGGSMLGRPRSWLLSVVLCTPLLLLAWRVLASSRYPDMMVEWTGRVGLRCFFLSSALAIVPLLGILWMRRSSDPIHPRLTAAGLGAAVGAASWVLVDLWCPVGYVPHLLLGHVLPLVVLSALSALIGGRLLALKSARRATGPAR